MAAMQYAQIAGWGMYVPSTVITNDAFVRMGLDTSDDWITSRTGIEQRYLVGLDEATSDLAIKAGLGALAMAEMHGSELDLVVVATCTPDHVMPSTASIVQNKLGADGAGALDMNAACAGFVYALSMAAGQIESGRARTVLVIGADELSIYLNWKDRNTCILFGDGAGAVLLKAADEPGIMSSTMGSDGSGAGLLTIPGGGSRHRVNSNGRKPAPQFLTMNGPQVFRWATQMMTAAAEHVITSSGLKPEEIDLFIPHQANMRIIESTAKRLGLDPDKVFANVDRYGNTSAASIPIALCEALDKDLIHVGDNIVLTSFGAGLSWAAVAVRWSAEIPAQRSPWAPFRQTFETRVAAVRSVLRRQQRRVGTVIDETLHRDS